MRINIFLQHIFLGGLFLLISYSAVLGIEADSVVLKKQLVKDSSQVIMRSIDQASLNAFAEDNDFNYKDEFEKPVSFWQQLLWWLNKQGELSSAISYTWKYGKYILIGLVIFLLVMQFLKVPITGLFSSRVAKNTIPFQITEEDIQEMDFDALVAEALQKKLYRNAIRYLYLKTLKQLSYYNYIQWQQDKTNTDYMNEIAHKELKKEFKQITTVFEKIWYGEFPANEKVVDELKPICKKVETIIQTKLN